jgi:hypothetical protein
VKNGDWASKLLWVRKAVEKLSEKVKKEKQKAALFIACKKKVSS